MLLKKEKESFSRTFLFLVILIGLIWYLATRWSVLTVLSISLHLLAGLFLVYYVFSSTKNLLEKRRRRKSIAGNNN